MRWASMRALPVLNDWAWRQRVLTLVLAQRRRKQRPRLPVELYELVVEHFSTPIV